MIEFNSFIPELVHSMPIEKSKINDFDWYKIMLKDYKSDSLRSHTAKCPGILSVCSTGWIQRCYQDIVITTNGDMKSFTWRSEIDQKSLTHGEIMQDYVSYHSSSQLFDFNQFKKDTLQTIIKIQSPWTVTVPKGYSLLYMPVPYNDSNEFTAAHGIVKDFNFLNVQLFWHCLNGEVLIKKGTPLQQYILVKDEQMDHVVNEVDSYHLRMASSLV
jgi:hypothetical protein